MAVMPTYGETIKIILSRTRSPMILKLGMEHQGLKVFKVNIIDDPWLTMTYLTAISSLAKFALLFAFF